MILANLCMTRANHFRIQQATSETQKAMMADHANYYEQLTLKLTKDIEQ